MKIKNGCLLREIGDSTVVVVTGTDMVDFRGMITLKNESAVFLYKCLLEETCLEELAEKLSAEYEITAEHALETAKSFVDKLREVNIIEE